MRGAAWAWGWLALPAALAPGCTFTADDLARPPEPGSGAPARVVLFRGSGEVFSSGLDEIAVRLTAAGTPATVLPSLSGGLARLPADGPLVLGGHSAGAFNAVRHALHAKRPVDLLLLFDPPLGRPMPIPVNVRRVVVMRGWPAEVRPAHPSTRVEVVELGSGVPVLGGLWDRTLGHLGVTSDPRAVAAAMRAVAETLAPVSPTPLSRKVG